MAIEVKMRIGIVFPQTEASSNYSEVKEYAQFSEDIGYDHILAYDHILGANADSRTFRISCDTIVMWSCAAADTDVRFENYEFQ